MTKPIMKCGHAANAVVAGTDEPCCAICVGIDGRAREVAAVPDLTGRVARCSYNNSALGAEEMDGAPLHESAHCSKGRCKCARPSSTDLPFFEYTPQRSYDRYYCGCWGWD